MATTRSKKQVSMADEDAAFFRNAYKSDPKARAALEKEGYKPTADKKKAPTKKNTGKK